MPVVRVIIPTALRQYAANHDAVEVEAASVEQALGDLVSQFDQLRRHLYAEDGRLRNFVNVYVNEEDIRYLQKDATPLKSGDTISIVPSIAGGSFSLMDRLASKRKDVLMPAEIKRYSRHLILPEVGMAGQLRLKQSSALIVGAGGLGVPLTQYLGAAGVGRLGIVDFDVIDETNLQRQVLYGTKDVGRKKIEVAKERVAQINPNVDVQTYETHLTSDNAMEILKDFDVVIDGTDNFPTRYLVNDACVMLKKPNVYGSIFRFEGMASVFAPHLGGPCYRCWYPEPPPPGLVPSCAEGGVLGVICGIIGNIQANEAIKLIIGKGKPLMGRLLRFDAMDMTFREYKIPRDPNCPVCGKNPTVTKLIDYLEFCGIGRGGEAGGTSGDSIVEQEDTGLGPDDISVEQLKKMRDAKEDFVLVDVRNPDEFEISVIDGSVKLPLPELPQRFKELPKDKLLAVHCKMGGRSARAVNFLKTQGYTKVKNVAGGINAWAERIDPNIPQY